MKHKFSFVVLILIFTTGCGNSGNNKKTQTRTTITNDNNNSKVVIKTSKGDLVVRLYDETPLHRDNFLKLADEGYYNGTLFHRVINKFMIQGGDPDSKNPEPDKIYGTGGPDYVIPAEFRPELFHKKGALAAARQDDNANPQKASSGSQFYLVQGRVFTSEDLDRLEAAVKTGNPNFKIGDEARKIYADAGGTPHLDGNYTVFGEIVDGLDVVDAIAEVRTIVPGDRPVEDIFILSVERKNK